MSPAELDLARELAARPWWEWRAGVLIADYGPGIRYCWQDETHLHGAAEEGGAWMQIRKGTGVYVPDLRDPTGATAGVLLAMLPRGVLIYDHGDEDGWEIREPLAYGSRTIGEGPTLAVAAARALLAVGGGA